MGLDGKRNVYENIANELRNLIAVGAFKDGDKLPSVREYAVERRVNPNTVAKAYLALEEEGLIAVQPKKGAFVLGRPEETRVKREIEAQLRVWKEAGVALQEILQTAEAVFKKQESEKND